MIGWLLSFALVVIFLLFMKDFIRLLFSGIGAFFIVMLIVLAITIVCYNIYQKALEKNYRNNIHL